MIAKLRRLIATLLVVSIAGLGLPLPVHAGMIGTDSTLASAERARITAVQEAPGPSANTLLLVGAPDQQPLLVVRYTQRQRGAMENLRFVLEEATEGRVVREAEVDAAPVLAAAMELLREALAELNDTRTREGQRIRELLLHAPALLIWYLIEGRRLLRAPDVAREQAS